MDHVGVRVGRGVDLSEVDLAHDREVERDVRHLRSIAEYSSTVVLVSGTAHTREGARCGDRTLVGYFTLVCFLFAPGLQFEVDEVPTARCDEQRRT